MKKKRLKVYTACLSPIDEGDEFDVKAASLYQARKKAEKKLKNTPEYTDMRLDEVVERGGEK